MRDPNKNKAQLPRLSSECQIMGLRLRTPPPTITKRGGIESIANSGCPDRGMMCRSTATPHLTSPRRIYGHPRPCWRSAPSSRWSGRARSAPGSPPRLWYLQPGDRKQQPYHTSIDQEDKMRTEKLSRNEHLSGRN